MMELATLIELAADLGTKTLFRNDSNHTGQKPAQHRRSALRGKSRPVSRSSDIRRLFGNIARDLDDQELQSENFELSESDIMEELEGPPQANRILGFYSAHGVQMAFERYGLLASLRSRGFVDLRFQIDPRDPDQQRVAVYGSRAQGREELLVELLVTRRTIELPTIMEPKTEALKMLSIEWLLLQDPSKSFSEEKPRLPGQTHPGLGMFREVVEALYQSCRRLGLDGLVMHPSWFHVGAIGSPECLFLDPAIEGRFSALKESLDTSDISKVSEILDHSLVVRNDGSAFVWEAEEFIVPVSKRLCGYFSSPNYAAKRELARDKALDDGIAVHDELVHLHNVAAS